MSERLRVWLGLVALVASIMTLGGMAAYGAGPALDYYLLGDSVPIASMSSASPPDISLPNYDPGRDGEPGLVLESNGDGAWESDPDKYQQWEIDASNRQINVNNLTIWVAMEEFAKTMGTFGVYVFDCGSGCTLLDSTVKAVYGKNTWSRMSIPLTGSHVFDSGHDLVVKIVVLSSGGDMWFAYGTATYAARLKVQEVVSPPSSTSTSTSTTSPTSSTTSTTTSTSSTSSSTSTTSTTIAATTSTTMPDEVPPSSTSSTLPPNPGSTSSTSTTSPASSTSSTSTTVAPDDDRPGASSGQRVVAAGPVDSDPPPPPPPGFLAQEPTGDSGPDGEMTASEALTSEIPRAVARITPQRGLTVAFATVTEAFGTQALPLLALALLGSVLFLAGASQDDEGAGTDGDPGDWSPGSWWFSG